MPIDYDHALNLHTAEGPQTALRVIFANEKPSSLLDVGCGTGTWLKAALELGILDVTGIDGVAQTQEMLLFPLALFRHQDITLPWVLNRRYDCALCLEVAEHLDPQHAELLVENLTGHAETIFFSAACPGQTGQHHVNCQWPSYWQNLFNARGYACDDWPRWILWGESMVEPWYRQNMFVAKRTASASLKERALLPVIHPDMLPYVRPDSRVVEAIEAGSQPIGWYFRAIAKGLISKFQRFF